MKNFKRIMAFILTAALVLSVCVSLVSFSAESGNDAYTAYYIVASQYGYDTSKWPTEAWTLYTYLKDGGTTLPGIGGTTTPTLPETDLKIEADITASIALLKAPYYYWMGEVSYQWEIAKTYGKYDYWTEIEGATNQTYMIFNPVPNAKYRVKISTSTGTFATQPVVITGIEDKIAPTVTVQSSLAFGGIKYWAYVGVSDNTGIAKIVIDDVEHEIDSNTTNPKTYNFRMEVTYGDMPTIEVTDIDGNTTEVLLYIDGGSVKVFNPSAPSFDGSINVPGITNPSDRDTLTVTITSHTAEQAVLKAPSLLGYPSYFIRYQWQILKGNSFVDVTGETAATLTVKNPVAGATYRVRIFDMYNNQVIDSKSVTLPELEGQKPVEPEVKPEDKFSLDDIVISGIPTDSITVGDLLILIPQPGDGKWIFDGEIFSGLTDGVTVLKAIGEGVTVLKYQVERDGETYVKSFIITVKAAEVIDEVGSYDD